MCCERAGGKRGAVEGSTSRGLGRGRPGTGSHLCNAKPRCLGGGGRGRAKRLLKRLRFQDKAPKAKLVRASGSPAPPPVPDPCRQLGAGTSPWCPLGACVTPARKEVTRAALAPLAARLLFSAQRCPSVQEGPGQRSPPMRVPLTMPEDETSFAPCGTDPQLREGEENLRLLPGTRLKPWGSAAKLLPAPMCPPSPSHLQPVPPGFTGTGTGTRVSAVSGSLQGGDAGELSHELPPAAKHPREQQKPQGREEAPGLRSSAEPPR